jgi:predicted hydrolase (HD superfamily)
LQAIHSLQIYEIKRGPRKIKDFPGQRRRRHEVHAHEDRGVIEKERFPMMNKMEALALLKEYNKEEFHLAHGQTVSGCMEYFANKLGYADAAEYWAVVGLLHDIDFEMYPEEHCIKAPDLLAEVNASPELVHAICSHAYGVCCDVEPVHQMEKVMFAVDELTGLIGAAARMRPSKSVCDMELSSLKKKFKDKKFAAGCSRDVIKEGADRLGWTLEETMEKTILAMRSCEASVAEEQANLCG